MNISLISFRHWLLDTAREYRGLMIFIVLMSIFRSSIADWNQVPSSSMRPTIIEGDRVLINKLAYDVQLPFVYESVYRHADPQRGDIVVFESERSGKRLIKRVIGLPGDQVAMLDNRVILNGELLRYQPDGFDRNLPVYSESLRQCIAGSRCTAHQVRLGNDGGYNPRAGLSGLRVPMGHYLVLGDNRANSADSRYIGFVPRDEIIGRARRVVISLDRDRYYLPRTQRIWELLDT